MTEAGPSPVKLAAWKIGLFFTVFIILVFGLLEWGARLYLKKTRGYDGKHLYQFVYDPYKNILPAPDFIDTRGIHHNSVGFRRDGTVPRKKPDGVYRIFLMGGSTAYGLGTLWNHIYKDAEILTDQQTIDHYLEQELAKALPGRKIEVINAAITSAWTHHHLIYLNQTLLSYQPDMVLFLDGFNDFYFFNDNHDQFADYDYNGPAQKIMGDPTIGSLAYANGWWLFRKSALVHLLARGAKNIGLLIAGKPEQTPMNVERSVATHRRVFTRSALAMHRNIGLILKDRGIIPVFMLQPMLILERNKPMNATEKQLFDFNLQAWRPNYEAYIQQAVATARELEGQMAPAVGGTFLDLTRIYDSVPGEMFVDYCHLTPAGNQILAHQVAENLLPLIRADTTN